MTMLTAPSHCSAPRQPYHSIRSWISGMNTVEAKPPHSVTVVMSRRAFSAPTLRAITAKAAS